MKTLADEWAEAARTLADHHTYEAAQRHARFKAHELPRLEDRDRYTPGDVSLVRAMRRLMLDFQLYGDGERGGLAAKGMRFLADALQAPDVMTEEASQKKTPSPENVPYRPGATE